MNPVMKYFWDNWSGSEGVSSNLAHSVVVFLRNKAIWRIVHKRVERVLKLAEYSNDIRSSFKAKR